jgi:hypothetical protein
MKTILFGLACVLLPVPGFSQQLSFETVGAPASLQRTDGFHSSHRAGTLTVRPFQMFPAAAACWQSPPTSTSAGTPPSTNIKPHQRPHLIELTRADWRPLTNSEKFSFFWRDLLHWETHASLLFDTGLSYVTENADYLGWGTRGVFTRYGLNVADEANFTFFNAFFFPTIFHQDPRYIPSDQGRIGTRLAYAASRVLIARADSGKSQINASRIVGDFVATSISSAMYSSYGADIGTGGNFADFGLNLATDAAFDVFKEFWPDLARKMKLNLWLRNLVRSALRDYGRAG